MSLNVESIDKTNVAMKVKGDLGDLQIFEGSESSENENEDFEEVGTVAKIPNNLIHASTTPVFGTVAVTNSENVQFGNNTYFNGPVTIKQIIQTSSEVENAAYQKTEDEDKPNGNCQSKDESCIVKLKLKGWHKLSLSAALAVLLASIVAVVVVVISHQREPDGSYPYTNSDSAATDLLISPEHLRIVSRPDWLAQPVEEKLDLIRQPVPWVIITHTATESCFTQSKCVLIVRSMQTFHIESRGWSDIGYNFMVGGDGSAYYGRGWDYVGAHTKGYNKYSIAIAFIGTFNTEVPTKHQVDACKKLIKLGVAEGKIAKDYKLLGHRQLMSTLSPGDKVYDIIKTWPHFYNETDISTIIPKY